MISDLLNRFERHFQPNVALVTSKASNEASTDKNSNNCEKTKTSIIDTKPNHVNDELNLSSTDADDTLSENSSLSGTTNI